MTFSRRALLGAFAAMPLSCRNVSDPPIQGANEPMEVLDLSHTLSPSSPYIQVRDATFPFHRAPIATIRERGVYANQWRLTEHIGTHVDRKWNSLPADRRV